MIPLQRVAAPNTTQTLLAKRTANVRRNGGTSVAARDEWTKAAAPKRHVRQLLKQMAHGMHRCMYCEDSLGTDIDHFQPIADAPLRAFDWSNHLLACSHCNSNAKRDEYPCDPHGCCLLVDPSVEDPADHLTLLLASGHYEARTPKGEATIRTFALNRIDLVTGRQAAFRTARAVLRDWHRHVLAGDVDEAREVEAAFRISPFAGVVTAMASVPVRNARVILGAETAMAVEAWRELIGLQAET
jgi:uncharacterized protein (TIGR02646 family)